MHSSHAIADQKNKINWMLNCQGCHGSAANSTGIDVPPLANTVAKFLSVPGGRDYLVKVPGVAMAPISDAQVASLTNWMLTTFDPEHIPARFKAYTAREVGRLRKSPYISEASAVRATLIRAIEDRETANNKKNSS
jgi:hypothetical protein